MTSIASWQVAHPALNTSIFRLAAISLVPPILALQGRTVADGNAMADATPWRYLPGQAWSCGGLKRETEGDRSRRARDGHRQYRIFATVGVYMHAKGTDRSPLFWAFSHGGSEVRGERDGSRFEPSPRTRG